MAAAEAGAYHVFGFGGSDGLAALDDLLKFLPNDPLLQTTVGASAASEVRMVPEPTQTEYTVEESDTVRIVVAAVVGSVVFVLVVLIAGGLTYRYCANRSAKGAGAAGDNNVASDFYGGGDGEGHMEAVEGFPYAAADAPVYTYSAPDEAASYRYRYTSPDAAEMTPMSSPRATSPPRRGTLSIAACVPVQEE